jgi:O-antigen/teichoic acid export membrane protein
MGEDVPMAQGPESQVSRVPEGEPIATQGISVQGTAIVGVGLAVSQVIALLQMLIVSRILGPEQFGAFGAMAVVLLIGSTVLAATQVTIARHVASGRSLHQIGASSVLAAGLATFAVGAAVSPLLSNVLNLNDVAGLMLVAATFIPFAITGAQLGLLQGYENHTRLGLLYVLSTVTRVVGAVIGAGVGQTADSAMVGLALGATAGAVVGHFVLVERLAWRSEEGTRNYLVEAGHAAHALIALYALTNLDVLLARAQLSAFDAGLYAAGALVARAVFFLPQAILVAAFPRIVAGARNAQRQAVAAVAVLGLLATAFVALFPTLVVGIMAGEQYLAVAGDAWIFALAGAGFGVVQILLYARMAHNDRRATMLLWTAVAALIGLGLILGTSITALVTCAAVVAWTTALLGVAWARLSPVKVTEDDIPTSTM